MTDRSAVDTIKGYFYQFDMSILSVLDLANDTDDISIECIEDIDLHTASDMTAIQCKYYAKSEYNHSAIKETVKYMLSHFKGFKDGIKPKISYVIRGHYNSGQEKLPTSIDVEFLKKNFLTYTTKKIERYHHTELDLDDADLTEFLGLLTLDINALEFDEQFHKIISQLQAVFKCTPFSAEFYYYNNALRIIKELAIKSNPADRTITKKGFLERINTSSILFNEWFVQKKGKKLHLDALRKEYFTALNVSPFERFFLVEIDPTSYIRTELKDLFFILSKKWSKTSKLGPASFCPYIFVQGISVDEILALKNELRAEGFKFIDGHDYQGADFSTDSIAQKATHSNGIKIKILNTLSNLEETVNSIKKTRKIYQFHLGQSYFEYESPSISHVKIQVEQLSDIKGVI
jgi:hypothetical protein